MFPPKTCVDFESDRTQESLANHELGLLLSPRPWLHLGRLLAESLPEKWGVMSFTPVSWYL